MIRRWILVLAIWSVGSVLAQPGPLDLRGNLAAHDPSTIIRCKDRYYTFHTGKGIFSSWSSNKVFWSAGPPVFAEPPSWTTNAVPEFSGTFWAPDVVYFNKSYHLYYSVSSWGSQVSAIGLATNPTLDPSDPDYRWTDHGIVIQSQVGSPFNTIDPSVTWDAQGNLWLVFGSYWSGIYLVQLNPLSGLRIGPNSPTYRLAWNSSIEASCIYHHGGYYYLFVNWGSCCSGVNSTYNVRVGRSTSITGPYLDAHGVNMVEGGGTLFMRASGKYTGPGHIAVLNEGGAEEFSFHYYDANSWAPNYGAYGAARLGLAPLLWTAGGWPFHTNDWSAVYDFRYDARDANGQYSGLLKNGARVQNDPSRGRVLNLDGTDQYVWLPPGVAYGKTFTAVVKWRGGGPWQRVFDFGFDTSRTFMLTPSAGSGVLRCDLNPGGNLKILQWDRPLPTNVWTQVAVTLDGSRGILFVNGSPVSTNESMNILPLNGAPQTNHLGRSKFVADDYFNGQFARFRVFDRVLSQAELIKPEAEIQEPVDGSFYSPGSAISFGGSASDFLASPLTGTNMTWTVKQINGPSTNAILGPLNGVTNGWFRIPADETQATNGFYQITLSVADTAGRRGETTVTILPTGNGGSANWSSYYPFTADGQDSSNFFNATLYGATVQTDSTRGKILNLSGASQYARLPAGAANAQTVSAWIKWRGGNAWQRLWDFGRSTSSWFYFTPKDGSGMPEAAFTSDRASYVRLIEADEPFPLNEWTHVAVVADGRQGVLYFNGIAVGINNSLNLLPSDVVGQNVFLGRSQFPNDPYLNAQIDSLRLSSSPLPPEDMFAPSARILQPAPGTLFSGGSTLPFSGEALDWTDTPLPAEACSWTVEYCHDGTIEGVVGPVTGPSGSHSISSVGPFSTNLFYRINLVVTNTNGLRHAATTDVLPRLSHLAFSTVPAGLTMTLEDQPIADGSAFDLVSGFQRTIATSSPQNTGGTNYNFVMWSDLGAAMHQIIVPLTNANLTASFLRPQIMLSGAGPGTQLTWPAWAQNLQLYTTTNLAFGLWIHVTNQPTASPTTLTLTLPADAPERYYRLQGPPD